MMTISKIKNFLFENQSVRQTILKNTFWLFFGETAGRLIRMGVIIYAARTLGAAGWGTFSYVISLAALLTIFSDSGLSSVLTREAAKSPADRLKFFSTIFFIKIPLIIISFFIIVLATPYISNIPVSKILIFTIALVIVFDSLKAFSVSMFRATEKMELEAALNILTQFIIAVAGIAVLWFITSVESLAAAYAFGSFIGLAATAFLLRSYIKNVAAHFDKNLIKPIINSALPFGLAGILGAVMINTDTVMLGWFRSAGEIGFYAAAQKPVLFLYVFSGLIAGALFPVFSRLAGKDIIKFRNVMEKGIKAVFLLAIPFTIGILITADQIINILYGQEYQPAAIALKILAITIITTFPMSIINNSLFAYNRQKELIYFWVAGALGNVFFNLIFIPIWGIAGAAAATVLTQIIGNSLIWRRVKKINNFSVMPHLKKILAASALMTLTALLLKQSDVNFFLIVAVAALVYFGALTLMKETLITEIKETLKLT